MNSIFAKDFMYWMSRHTELVAASAKSATPSESVGQVVVDQNMREISKANLEMLLEAGHTHNEAALALAHAAVVTIAEMTGYYVLQGD